MIVLTSTEIERYRTELADNSAALRALEMIEDCEGDVEDAAIALALRVGQEPDRSEQWLDGLAKRWRVFLCQADVQAELTQGTIANAISLLSAETTLPAILATPVVLYVLKTGVEGFCAPLGEKR
jgi:hypothetical protein